jgi:DNA topoisomerase-1
VPTFTAFAVTSLLEEHFPDLVDTAFTSKMEHTLDEIATGEAKWLPYLEKFYKGEKGLETQVKVREKEIDSTEAKTVQLKNLEAKVRIGKYGPFIEVENGEDVITASIPLDLTPADLNPEQIESILRQKIEGPDKVGIYPDTGEPIYLKTGPYGDYIQLGDKTDENPKPKQVSLPKGMNKENVDLDIALGLLSLPRALGVHPETGGKIKASLGRFGPYVVHEYKDEGEKKQKKDYRSLKAEDNVLTVSYDRAMELLAQPKRSRGGSSKKPLRELGSHPEDNEPINVYKGPYGNYIKHGKINVGIPEGETVESISLEQAVGLLAEKAATKKTRSKSTKRKSTKKKTS